MAGIFVIIQLRFPLVSAFKTGTFNLTTTYKSC